jgi:valyl-tRNA synthetase
VIDPLEVFDQYGTDAVRFALISATTAGASFALQESKMGSARNFANKIWNATRFVLLNCGELLDAGKPVEWETELAPPLLADRWILSRFNRIALEVHDALADFRFHEAAATLYHFFWDDFCDWYIELSKPYVSAKEETPQNMAVKRRIIYVLERSLRLLHPLMPFITEDLWQRLPHQGETICLAEFPRHNAAQLDGRAEREMEIVIELVTKLRHIRSTFNIAPSASVRAQIGTSDETTRDVIMRMESHIKRLARIEQLELSEQISARRGAARAVMSGAEIAVPLEGLIDFDQERARLERERQKLAGESEGLERRLANSDFINRAAADVVAATQARAAELRDQVTKLQGMLENL